MAQELVHRRHDVGMRIERAAGEADVGRPVVAKALHQFAAAAHDADRKPAAERLAVGHEIGAHAEIVLRAAVGEAEADEHLVEDQDDVAFGADRAQPFEPRGIGRPVEMCARVRCRPAPNRSAPTRSDAAPATD